MIVNYKNVTAPMRTRCLSDIHTIVFCLSVCTRLLVIRGYLLARQHYATLDWGVGLRVRAICSFNSVGAIEWQF